MNWCNWCKWGTALNWGALAGGVFEAEGGDFFEVAAVAGPEGGVEGEGDGGNFEVHGADADFQFAKALKFDGGPLGEGENGDGGIEGDVGFKFSVGLNFAGHRVSFREPVHPASHLFFIGDDGDGEVLVRTQQYEPLVDALSEGIALLEKRNVVGVEDDHLLDRRLGGLGREERR